MFVGVFVAGGRDHDGVGEGAGRGVVAALGDHRHVHRAFGVSRGGAGDLGAGRVGGHVGRFRAIEEDRHHVHEAGAGDGHAGAAVRGTGGGSEAGDHRRRGDDLTDDVHGVQGDVLRGGVLGASFQFQLVRLADLFGAQRGQGPLDHTVTS